MDSKRSVVVVHSNLKTDAFEHLDVQLPDSVVIVSPSATDEELKSVGVNPLTPEQQQRLKEKTETELSSPSRVHVIDEIHLLLGSRKE